MIQTNFIIKILFINIVFRKFYINTSYAPSKRTFPNKSGLPCELVHDVLQASQHLRLLENYFFLSLKLGLNIRHFLTLTMCNLLYHLRSHFN